jgi:hypothetical protein
MFSNVFSRIRMLTLLCVYFLKIKTQFGKSEARTLSTVFNRFQEARKRLVRSSEEETLDETQASDHQSMMNRRKKCCWPRTFGWRWRCCTSCCMQTCYLDRAQVTGVLLTILRPRVGLLSCAQPRARAKPGLGFGLGPRACPKPEQKVLDPEVFRSDPVLAKTCK